MCQKVFVLVQSNVTFSGCHIFHVYCMFFPCSVPFSGAASSLNGFWIHPVKGPARAACCVSCSLSEYIENAGNTSTERTGCSTGCPVASQCVRTLIRLVNLSALRMGVYPSPPAAGATEVTWLRLWLDMRKVEHTEWKLFRCLNAEKQSWMMLTF